MQDYISGEKFLPGMQKGVLSILGACVKSGDEVEFIFEGEDEEAAAREIIEMIESGFRRIRSKIVEIKCSTNFCKRKGEGKMNRATLVIMAAGIGSRFGGGIKQWCSRTKG